MAGQNPRHPPQGVPAQFALTLLFQFQFQFAFSLQPISLSRRLLQFEFKNFAGVRFFQRFLICLDGFLRSHHPRNLLRQYLNLISVFAQGVLLRSGIRRTHG